MKPKEILSFSFSGLLVICMLTIIALFVRWEFFIPSSHHHSRMHQIQRLQHQTRKIKNWQQLKLNGQRTGPANAPVQIVEFFDYECPFCKASEPAIKTVRREYPKKVAIIHENYPLNQIHPYAYKAAIAAECARRQGAFMAYHNALFANQRRLGKLSYINLAAQVGIEDTTTFHRCVKDKETAGIIKSNKALGNKLNINGTPTFLINGTLVVGELSAARLEGLVQDVLAEATE